MVRRSQKRDASKTNRQLSLITDRPESANRDSAETRRRPRRKPKTRRSIVAFSHRNVTVRKPLTILLRIKYCIALKKKKKKEDPATLRTNSSFFPLFFFPYEKETSIV